MKVHHLNCGSMRLPTAPLVCHVLLLETDNGLVLVDTGFGLEDIANPGRRIGPYRHVTRPVLDPEETAAHQVERLSFRRDDVRHIVLTHCDADHIGGLADFPDASVHLTRDESYGGTQRPTFRERRRYNTAQFAHGPKLVAHEPTGESWRGFAAAKQLTEIDPGVVLIPLPGHTRGHAAVAVESGDRWLLQAGDAFYHHGTLDGRASVPTILNIQERAIAFDYAQVRDNHRRLAELHAQRQGDLDIICAHAPTLFQRMSGKS